VNAAGRVVDHADQVQFRPTILQPGVFAGVPLDQFAHSAAARPPLMDLVDALPAGTPQLAFDHPTSHRLPSGVNAVLAGQVFRRQRGTEAPIDIAAQYLQRLLLRLLFQLPVGLPSSQSMHQRAVALAFQAP
jgi:hypothetical protein